MADHARTGIAAAVISAASVHFAYATSAPILRDIGFKLDKGRILGLAGPNGAGKSTLLALLAGLLTPSSGTLRVAGVNALQDGDAVRRKTALVLQEADLTIIGTTIDEDICLGLPPERRDEALDLAVRLRLPDPETPVHTLSHGQKRKLCLATALLRQPELLLLDEPFAGLDYPGIREIRAMLQANQDNGLTQIIACHDLEPLADLADLWLVLSAGRQAAFGPAREVFPLLESLDVRPPCSWRTGMGILPWDDRHEPSSTTIPLT
ncbi:energy-coupling factor ABC transporter ATP-binding protein [Desulfonatronum sp. SC1]|uniref:energy-coupling factor ABC transporter ATP-binding protein n=1 Tax=Desulfonatronum sp. SC1 TaxID=2109626 RepID=UPI000D3106D3|nr:ABC transporter ATP-binding protein [Desulfonatronum sp. SC1]PTN35157.1 ABC transporter [Desulfonatronum sp. SC1]